MSMKAAAAQIRGCWHNTDDMSATTAAILRLLGTLLATLLIVLPTAWGTFALWYQAPGFYAKRLIIIIWMGFSIGVLVLLWRQHAGSALMAFALVFALMLIWWQTLSPTNDK